MLFSVLLLSSLALPNTVALIQDASESKPKSVTLTIQFDKEKKKVIKEIPFKEKMTVMDVMVYSKEKKKITFVHSGKGELAFLKSIDGVKNKGARGDNWIFRVNGKLGKTSFGIAKLKPGDKVTWTFGKYKP